MLFKYEERRVRENNLSSKLKWQISCSGIPFYKGKVIQETV
jgi:hypothetical protein